MSNKEALINLYVSLLEIFYPGHLRCNRKDRYYSERVCKAIFGLTRLGVNHKPILERIEKEHPEITPREEEDKSNDYMLGIGTGIKGPYIKIR